jgi:membrane protein
MESTDTSPLTPEAREHGSEHGKGGKLHWWTRLLRVSWRVAVGVYSDGFIHAGNLAYLTLMTLFPFFIVTAALARLAGRSGDGMHLVHSFLDTLPPSVAALLVRPISDVLAARTGSLLWLGALVGLWTVGSFVETIRDILRRAYGVTNNRSFWRYRMGSAAIIIGSVILAMLAFSVQVVMTATEQAIYYLMPVFREAAGWIGASRLVPLLVMIAALYGLFYTLTPAKYRNSPCPKWPGALFTALWWFAATVLLPLVLSWLGGYDRTYGSLAGVIIALFFFWIVGFGLVIGAHLNAALAETPEATVKEPMVQGRGEQ